AAETHCPSNSLSPIRGRGLGRGGLARVRACSVAPSPQPSPPLREGEGESHVLAAVDVQLGAGDVAGLIRTQIVDGFRHLLRQTEAAQRNGLDDLLRSRR